MVRVGGAYLDWNHGTPFFIPEFCFYERHQRHSPANFSTMAEQDKKRGLPRDDEATENLEPLQKKPTQKVTTAT